MRTTTATTERALRQKERLIARLRGLGSDAQGLQQGGDAQLRRVLGGLRRELAGEIERLQGEVARARAQAEAGAAAAGAAP